MLKVIMRKRNLVVFIGKPGAGKSTLISSFFSGQEVIDVFPYIMRHKKKGKVPEAQTIHAYREMYGHIGSQNFKGDLILELGTNHSELNAEELEKLKGKFNLKIFLCDAPKHICRSRAIKRGRKFDKKALELRLERDFPNSHTKLLEESGMKFDVLDMTRPLEKIRNDVGAIINQN
jgi:dephospho-CoA kinase